MLVFTCDEMHFIYLWFPTSQTRIMVHLGSETPIYPPKILISHDLNICIFLNPNLDNFSRPWLKNMKTHIPVLFPSPINFWMIILGSEDMIRWTYSAKSDFPSYSRYWTRVSCSEASSITPSLCQVPETSNTWTNYQKSGINSTHNENKKKMFDLDNHGYTCTEFNRPPKIELWLTKCHLSSFVNRQYITMP